MKVQCDVCAASAASIFCCADEAALCGACDRHVHRANKLAGKHRRFPLIHAAEPSSAAASSAQKTKPLCDICQERKGFFFCKEERSILCRECDVRVHTATELMRRHSRFLLTDVHLSSAPVDSPAAPEEEEEENGSISHSDSGGASASDGSSISEYLTKTLPGWHVEDLLVDADIAACFDGLDQAGQVQVGGLLEEACPAWAAGGQQVVLGDVVVVTGDERATSRVQCVPQMQMQADWTGSKRPRASPPPPNW